MEHNSSTMCGGCPFVCSIPISLTGLASGNWEKIHDGTTAPCPTGRYSHNSVSASGGFLMFGGILLNGSISNDLWLFDVGQNDIFAS